MPLCGFNNKMLEGLRNFSEGLVEHGLVHRSKLNGETIEQGIKRELSDISRFLHELDGIDDTSKKILTEGLLKYAFGFYLMTRKLGTENYKDLVDSLCVFFEKMDDKYYSDLENKSSDMEDLVTYLNTIEISESK